MTTVATDITMTTVATCITDGSNIGCYCASVGLVPLRSLKLGLSYLKIEACRVVSNLVTRTRVHVQERLRGFGEAVQVSR
jgi:hypothetical protein